MLFRNKNNKLTNSILFIVGLLIFIMSPLQSYTQIQNPFFWIEVLSGVLDISQALNDTNDKILDKLSKIEKLNYINFTGKFSGLINNIGDLESFKNEVHKRLSLLQSRESLYIAVEHNYKIVELLLNDNWSHSLNPIKNNTKFEKAKFTLLLVESYQQLSLLQVYIHNYLNEEKVAQKCSDRYYKNLKKIRKKMNKLTDFLINDFNELGLMPGHPVPVINSRNLTDSTCVPSLTMGIAKLFGIEPSLDGYKKTLNNISTNFQCLPNKQQVTYASLFKFVMQHYGIDQFNIHGYNLLLIFEVDSLFNFVISTNNFMKKYVRYLQIEKEKYLAQIDKEKMLLIKKVQRKLKEKGYAPGKVDGVFGKNTKIALVKFQEDQGIPTTGAIDEITINTLFKVKTYFPGIIML